MVYLGLHPLQDLTNRHRLLLNPHQRADLPQASPVSAVRNSFGLMAFAHLPPPLHILPRYLHPVVHFRFMHLY